MEFKEPEDNCKFNLSLSCVLLIMIFTLASILWIGNFQEARAEDEPEIADYFQNLGLDGDLWKKFDVTTYDSDLDKSYNEANESKWAWGSKEARFTKIGVYQILRDQKKMSMIIIQLLRNQKEMAQEIASLKGQPGSNQAVFTPAGKPYNPEP